ncbi:MAG: ATP-binding protein [Myxococcales bacterium]
MHPYGTSSYEPTELHTESVDARSSVLEPTSVEGKGERAARVLIETIRALSGTRSAAAIADVVRKAAAKLVGADGTSFLLREGDAVVCVDEECIEPSWRGKLFPLSECVAATVLEHGEQIAIPDLYADPRINQDNFRGTNVRGLVLTPVRGNPCVALIAAFWSHTHGPSEGELLLLQDLADATAVATENAGLHAELERRVERRTLELRDANRDLEAFSYSVAHDLRAPLSAMLVTRSILERSYGSALDSHGVKLLRDIERTGKRMGELIGGLLQFARCARVELSREAVDLSALAAGVVMALRQQNLSRQVHVRIEPGLRANADSTLMEVVIANLLNNAFKYTRERPLAEIHVGQMRELGGHAFYVRDNGAGFDMASSAELFLPFKRLHPSHLFDGHGVGLATVSRIIGKHGGRVWAESQPGVGATFYFTLPSLD